MLCRHPKLTRLGPSRLQRRPGPAQCLLVMVPRVFHEKAFGGFEYQLGASSQVLAEALVGLLAGALALLPGGGQVGGAGGGRQPNRYEKKVFDLWKKLHLHEESFSGGNVIAFLNQVQHIVGN